MGSFEDFTPYPHDPAEGVVLVPPSAEVVREERISRIAAYTIQASPDDTVEYDPHRHGALYATFVVAAGVLRLLGR